jgi:hypothetical protein
MAEGVSGEKQTEVVAPEVVVKRKRRSPLSKRWVVREALPNVPPRPPKAPEPPAKPLKPSQCAGHMRKRLAEEFPRIVNGFVKEVKRGSVPHVRLATELLKAPPAKPKKTLAEKMLEELGRASEVPRAPDGTFVR